MLTVHADTMSKQRNHGSEGLRKQLIKDRQQAMAATSVSSRWIFQTIPSLSPLASTFR